MAERIEGGKPCRISYTDADGRRRETVALSDGLADTVQALRAIGATALCVERGRADLAEADDLRTAPPTKGAGWCWGGGQ